MLINFGICQFVQAVRSSPVSRCNQTDFAPGSVYWSKMKWENLKKIAIL